MGRRDNGKSLPGNAPALCRDLFRAMGPPAGLPASLERVAVAAAVWHDAGGRAALSDLDPVEQLLAAAACGDEEAREELPVRLQQAARALAALLALAKALAPAGDLRVTDASRDWGTQRVWLCVPAGGRTHRRVLRAMKHGRGLWRDATALRVRIYLRSEGEAVRGEPRIRARDDFAEAVALHLLFHLGRLRAHECLALDGRDPEGVHQMRVALRRIRSALRALPRGAPDATVPRSLRVALRALGRRMGTVRDEDVFLMLLRDVGRDLGGAADALVARMGRAAEERRAEARRRIAAYLDGPEYQRTVDRLLAQVGRLRRGGADRTLRQAARRAMRWAGRRYAGVRDELKPADPASLHALRVAAKRLRYTAELVCPADGRYRRLARRLADMQEALGDVHDLDVAAARARDPAVRGEPGIAALWSAIDTRRQRLVRGLPRRLGRVDRGLGTIPHLRAASIGRAVHKR